MTNNNLHNLMTQMTQEQKSLWRIEKHYIEEAVSEEEKALWEKMKEDFLLKTSAELAKKYDEESNSVSRTMFYNHLRDKIEKKI